MNAPRISVICIFYNAERFFAEAIDSVLAQEGTDFELILADDGSTDGSTAMALDYVRREPHRVRYVEHEGHANRGMSATRNLGLASSTGEYVAFIDADDRWRPGKLAEQAAILDANPKVGMVCGAVNYWGSWDGGRDRLVATGDMRDRILRPPHTALWLYPLGTAEAPCPSDVMIRRSVVDAVGGFEVHFTGSLQMYEDQGFFSKVYITAPVYFSTQVWCDYRLHEESISATVTRNGQYDEVRSYFLTWFGDYLKERRFAGKAAVAWALRKARFRMAHPRLARLEARLVGRRAA